jgi:F-type H+-transporting ATPase subunit gamma
VKNTKKITEAMRLVAAAKVRRAQQAVLQTRPFTEKLQGIFGALVGQLGKEDVKLPILDVREVNSATVVGISGDRGLCGGYNSYIIKKTEMRIKELTAGGVDTNVMLIGKKVSQYFKRRQDIYNVIGTYDCGQAPDGASAQKVSRELLASFIGKKVDVVEFIYTRFVSLIAAEPAIRTMLPLSLSEISAQEDELWALTSADGKFAVSKKVVPKGEPEPIDPELCFEQDPIQLLNAILPLYLDGQILRMLQESVACELASRMQAMQAASDNAADITKSLSQEFNRARQAAVTQELSEIVAGANA